MGFSNVLETIIVDTFENRVGRMHNDRAMLVNFRLNIDYEKEEGYRYLDVLIYAPTNYVKVYTRERWTVIAVDDMETDEMGEFVPKEGKEYSEGESEWKRWSDHDSGWRSDGIGRILSQYHDRISMVDSFPQWYRVVDMQWLQLNLPQESAKYAVRP